AMAADNKSLGKFILDGLPPAPRGVPQIEVTFDINADGILNVSAMDKATNREQTMQIVPSSGLRDEEIDRMVRDAEQYASEDTQRRESVEARNTAESAVHGAERFVQENSDKLTDAQKTAVNEEISKVRAAQEGSDTEALRQAVDALSNAIQQIGAAMYQQNNAAPSAQPENGSGNTTNDDDVIEGEFQDT
ncbi:MAG: Hsp70 family protein, partial [Anaerolineales bacterium]|nr:Hsp70 family protein [Anaerolineales bacterium]